MMNIFLGLCRAVFHVLGIAFLLAMPSINFAGELYPSGQVREYQQFEALESSVTGGGYAIFQGERPWKIVSAKVVRNNMDIGISTVHLFSSMGGDYFAEMLITISLGGGEAPSNAYFTGDPCAQSAEALIRINKAARTNDNCLTIKPLTFSVQGKSAPMIEVHIRNSQSSFRLYDIRLFLSLDKLGFPNSKDSDWTADQYSNNVTKVEFIKKIANWGEKLQDAVNQSLAFSKPQDSFQKVPSIDTLVMQEKTVLPKPENSLQKETLQ